MKKLKLHVLASGILSASLLLSSVIPVFGTEDGLIFDSAAVQEEAVTQDGIMTQEAAVTQDDALIQDDAVTQEGDAAYEVDGDGIELIEDRYFGDEFSSFDSSFSDDDGFIYEENGENSGIVVDEWTGNTEEYNSQSGSDSEAFADFGSDIAPSLQQDLENVTDAESGNAAETAAEAENLNNTESVNDETVIKDSVQEPDELLTDSLVNGAESSLKDTDDVKDTEDPAAEEIHELMLAGPLDPNGKTAYGIAPAFASVSDIEASSIRTACDIYNGSNVEMQDYSIAWAEPISSYLIPSPDGDLMRVQSGAIDDKLLIEYYDWSYNYLRNVTLDLNYPIFGGFFEGPDAYYILTGDENKEESNDAVVFSVAKYTKDWDYVASADLKGANTTVPFDASSARFAMSGKYLIIRTGHEMYKTPDGVNHQANVMFQIDTDTMKVTDSFSGIVGGVGYVSHSFNQFVLIENDAIVSLDQGDGFPRGLALIKYPATVSKGYFEKGWDTNCQESNVFSFPGKIGDNYTGACVGGFLSSDSHYLIAGNYTIDPIFYNPQRNVFVEAVPKSGGDPVVRYFTSYAGSSDSASTPHLVSIGDNRFLLLWSSQAVVYYMPVDGSGQACGDVHSFKGNLSDCVPLLIGDKLIWYTWDYETTVFYEISTSDLSNHDAVIIVNGHKYEFSGIPVDGEIDGACRYCGKKTKGAVPTGIDVSFRKRGSYYVGDTGIELSPGGQVDYGIQWSFSSDLTETLDDCEVISSEPDIVCSNDPASCNSFISTGLKIGKAAVTFRSRYNPSVSDDYTVYVNCLYDESIERTDQYVEKNYTGRQVKVPVKVWFDGKVLTAGTDYKLIWSDNINAGTAKVTAKGIGAYTGSASLEYPIKPASLKEKMFKVPSSPLIETGSPLKPEVSGSANGAALKEGTDYEIKSYSCNTEPGTGYVLVEGKGNYRGECLLSFEIKKSPKPFTKINKSMFTVPSSPFIETGAQIKPSVVGTVNGKKLKKGTDYVIDGYSSNVKPGTGHVIVRGIGDYGGTCSIPFVIISDSTLYASVSRDPLLPGETANISVTGAKGEVTYKSSDSAVAVVSGKGKVTAKKPGTATITVNSAATSQYKARSAKIKIHIVPGATSSVKISNTATGMKVTWNKVSGATGYDLYCDGYPVLSNKNTLSYNAYASNGIAYTYKVVARGSAGISTKSKSVTQVFMKQPEITELTSRKSGRIGCWWSKNKESSGSEMQYSTSKNFKSAVHTVDLPKADTRNCVVNGLPGGKTYYVRVRRYIKSGSRKSYSAWSAVKSIRIS